MQIPRFKITQRRCCQCTEVWKWAEIDKFLSFIVHFACIW